MCVNSILHLQLSILLLDIGGKVGRVIRLRIEQRQIYYMGPDLDRATSGIVSLLLHARSSSSISVFHS